MTARLSREAQARLIAARRSFALPGYASYADVGVEGAYVTPYQLSCGNPAGPVLISYNWLDAPTARANRRTLARQGYLPGMLFNRVLDRALELAGLDRSALYLSHVFHLLPATRSAAVPRRDMEASFDAITRHEIADRPVIALGTAAARSCARFKVPCQAISHPSARGLSIATKARQIAQALRPGVA